MPPEVVSIAITPNPATCTDHGQVQLTVTATYDDASTADLTSTCYFEILVPGLYEGIATLGSGSRSHPGLVTGLSPGTVTVRAQYPSFYPALG